MISEPCKIINMETASHSPPKAVIVYFHGYGSNVNTEKVATLKKLLPNADVYAYDIDINPVKAHLSLTNQIDRMLVSYLDREIKLIFIGTSLGAWWATKMADLYGAKAYLINGSFDPSGRLTSRYGVDKNIAAAYSRANLNSDYVYLFGTEDSVIDHTETIDELKWIGAEVEIVKGADHQFGGEWFEAFVVKHLR